MSAATLLGAGVCGMVPNTGAATAGAASFETPIAWLYALQSAVACELAAAAYARASSPVGPDIVCKKHAGSKADVLG